MALQDGKRRAEHPRSLMQRKNHRLQFRSRRGGHRSARVCLKVQRQLDEGHLPHSRLPLQLPQPAQQGLSERRLPPPLRVGHLADHELVLRPRPWFGSQQLRIGEGTRRPSWLVEQALEEPLPAHPHPQDPAKQGKQCAHKLAGRSHRGSLEQVHRGRQHSRRHGGHSSGSTGIQGISVHAMSTSFAAMGSLTTAQAEHSQNRWSSSSTTPRSQ
mmetsp:Transcript_95236/g.164346  ORF Transcript_95236/g.164346 Transcript_95236/m.164346 type:complete len:214 (-) Transcript_95236:676-1317(-)